VTCLIDHGKSLRIRKQPLNLCLLRDFEGVINLDAKIANSALELGVPEEQLDRSDVLGTLVDQSGFGASERVRPVSAWIKADAKDPALHDGTVLLWAKDCGLALAQLGLHQKCRDLRRELLLMPNAQMSARWIAYESSTRNVLGGVASTFKGSVKTVGSAYRQGRQCDPL
jgi:hypothetical protein